MSNIISSAKGLFNNAPAPWTRLKGYTSISVIGLDGAGKSTLLQHIASQHPSQPPVLDYIPSLGLNLEILNRGQFVITAQDVGASRPAKWNRDVEVLALNGMAIIFVVDARARGRLDDALMEIERFVPQGRSGSTKSPLAIWCNFCDAQVSDVSLPGDVGLTRHRMRCAWRKCRLLCAMRASPTTGLRATDHL